MTFHIRPWRLAVLLAFSTLLVGLPASASILRGREYRVGQSR